MEAIKKLEQTIAQTCHTQGLHLGDLVEELSANGVARRPWTSAFRALANDPTFVNECWGKMPFRLSHAC